MENIKLPVPNKNGGATIQEAFANRKSYRGGISGRKLSDQQLSDLLWSANGINRPDGYRTAASAINGRDIDIYALTEQAVYKYNPDNHELVCIVEGDHRHATSGGQEFVNIVPVVLVLVSDSDHFLPAEKNYPGVDFTPFRSSWAEMDAGIVSQNINLHCAGNGLATITRASMDKTALKEILKLKDTQIPLLNNAVGFPE